MAAIVIPNQGEEVMLDLILAVNMTMRLFSNDVTSGLTASQIEALTESSFTEATFTGYAAKALTGGSWTTTQADPSTGVYAQQTYTRTATGTAQTLYGYSMHRTSDNKLLWFEYFTGPITVATNGDTIQITPTITLDDDQEATVAARGLVAIQTLTANSSGYTSTTTATDMVLNNFDADGTRNYRIGLLAEWGSSTTGLWVVSIYIDGVRTPDIAIIAANGASNVLINGVISSQYIWQPATGQYDLAIGIIEVSGSTTITFSADSSGVRQFWIEDIGPR